MEAAPALTSRSLEGRRRQGRLQHSVVARTTDEEHSCEVGACRPPTRARTGAVVEDNPVARERLDAKRRTPPSRTKTRWLPEYDRGLEINEPKRWMRPVRVTITGPDPDMLSLRFVDHPPSCSASGKYF